MSFSFTALVLCFLRFHSIHGQSFPFLPRLDFPEIDGSAVEDTCRIFVVSTSEAPTTTSTTQPTTITTTSPITRRPVVTTTQKPTVQSSPRKPVTEAPIRTQPAVREPITNHHNKAALHLLHYLLANRRRQAAASQPMGGVGVSSSSDESAGIWSIRAGSSQDSSDES